MMSLEEVRSPRSLISCRDKSSTDREPSSWVLAQWLRTARPYPQREPQPSPEATMTESRLPIHPYAELFPPMTSQEFYRLCASIVDIGLKEEIVLYEGKILDGRCRYLACLLKNVQPRFRDYAGECGSPLI